jgi:predicted ester cyclase
MKRHRALAPLITLLAIATGVTLFATGWTLARPAVSLPPSAGTDQVVREFYGAINAGIRTGDTTLLQSIVAEDAAIHGGPATLSPGSGGLTRYVSSLHATIPQLELSVVDIVSGGDRSLVDIATHGAKDGEFLGRPISGNSSWGELDALRVIDRKVVEYWSGTSGIAMFEPLARAPFPEMGADRAVALDRLSILPGESFIAEGRDESRWLFVESGQFTLSATRLVWGSSDWSLAPAIDSLPLGSGDLLAVPVWSRSELRNDGREQANVLVLVMGLSSRATPRLDPAYPQGQSTTYTGQKLPSWWAGVQEHEDGGAMVTSLAENMITTLPANGGNLAIARVTMAPGSVITLDKLEGPYFVSVNAGSLELRFVVPEPDGLQVIRQLDAGIGTLVDSDQKVSLSDIDAAPVQLTVVAILPAEALISDVISLT